MGRGHGSGRGTTAGRGTKGQSARSGGKVHPRFEGGQLPLVQRLPYKRGFTNIFRTEYQVVNVAALDRFPEGAEVGPEDLLKAGLVKSARLPVKVLGGGELSKPLMVRANRFSASAASKIKAAGGSVEVLEDVGSTA